MNISAARNQMIGQQVRAGDVLDAEVLRVLSEVQRELFVPPQFRSMAFADTSIPLAHGQAMMTPQLEGRLLQSLEATAGDRVLEVGTGSGFLAACLARLGGPLTTLEIFSDLADSARRTLRECGTKHVEVLVQDVFGWQPVERFNCIAVTGSLPLDDPRFRDWLAPGGRLFMVVGTPPAMEAVLVRHEADGTFSRQSLFETVLGALINAPQPEQFEF